MLRNPHSHQDPLRAQKYNDLETILELIPHAAVLLDLKSKNILLANAKTSELTLYTRSELAGLSIINLLSNWDGDPAGEIDACFISPDDSATPKRQVVAQLIPRNRTPITIQIICARIPTGSQQALTILEPIDPGTSSAESTNLTQIWQSAGILATAQQETDLDTALKLALTAGSTLAGRKILAIYRAHEDSPHLQRYASLGPADLLPEYLSAQNLIHLKKPGEWRTGKRPICELQRAARAARLTFLASAPIGQPNAIIGLIIIADNQLPAPNYILQTVELLASAITSIFQTNIRSEETLSKLGRLEALLKFSETLEEHIHEGVITLDCNLNISRINLAAEMILGYTSDEVTSQPVESILIGPDSLSPALTAAQRGSTILNLGEIRIYRRNGEAFLALIRAFPVLDQDCVHGIIVLIQDLSEQEQIRRHAQQLEHHATLGEVTAVFAHEVRNPINNISTGLQLMAMNLPTNDPSQESIARMLQDCDRLAELIKSVLAFSRPAEFEMETLDLTLLLERLLERLRPRILRLNVKYEIQVEADCPPIHGNLRALEQVFNNLITNALQAMGETGGNLVIKVQSVSTPEGQSYIEVSVADTGPGIPKEIQERIFQPFFTTERSGTGLGLAIAKRIVTAHRGNIHLNSFPGGTIFYVQFPTKNPK